MEEQAKINRQMMEEIKEMESQFSKLAGSLVNSERGKLPSQPQFNTQGQHMAQTSNSNDQNVKEANDIITKSGKALEDPPIPNTTLKFPNVVSESVPSNASTKVPFPQALRPAGKIPENRGEILEHLTQDICTVKRKHHVKKTAFLTEQVSAVIEQKTPPKYKDPGCPTISCQIGTHEFSQALLDLGASVNLMPYSVYLQLGLGEIKPTSVVLQLADRSIKKPRGIVEDVLVQVDKFYYPVEFLILDTQFVVNMKSKIPIILGRPFLATTNALINCRNGLMQISFGNMTLEVNIFHVAKQPRDDDECYQTFLIDTLIPEEYSTTEKELLAIWSSQDRRKFLVEVRNLYWDDPYLFKYFPNQIMRRCIPDDEVSSVLIFCHNDACGGHFSVKKTAAKILQCGLYWPTLFKDTNEFFRSCVRCQKLGSLSRHHMMPLNPILVIEIFDCWGIDFMGPFPSSSSYIYILLVLDYVSKWVEVVPCRTNDNATVTKFLKENILSRFGTPHAIISDQGTHFCN
ncbi:uncharacterized protein LOC133814955 [Humulus lupulus]|uniref:uncharacterized protein LOC133814955 n=1 Tax=Humulus lupulus TaxID=3486 RepID=UPI002B407EE3|nr:uncharacterized protein LOC133814955 [Humulus lupulus]